MTNYYRILNVKPGATKAQIKSAYRKLAKKYHPDVSREDNAEAKFIEITEAYDFLIEGREKSRPKVNYASTTNTKSEEEIRRDRARQYARMQYESFKRNNEAFQKSWYYGPVKFGVYSIIIFGYLLAIAMFFAPVIMWFIVGDKGIAFLMIIVTAFSVRTYKYARDLQREVKPYFAYYK